MSVLVLLCQRGTALVWHWQGFIKDALRKFAIDFPAEERRTQLKKRRKKMRMMRVCAIPACLV